MILFIVNSFPIFSNHTGSIYGKMYTGLYGLVLYKMLFTSTFNRKYFECGNSSREMASGIFTH